MVSHKVDVPIGVCRITCASTTIVQGLTPNDKDFAGQAHGLEPELWTIRVTIAGLASVITALEGPFTTKKAFSFPQRLLCWGGMIMALLLPAYVLRKPVMQTIRLPQPRLDITASVTP